MNEIIFHAQVASMADISMFVVKITFVMAAIIIIKEHVITSSVAKITFVVDETTFNVAVITFFKWPILFFVVTAITFKLAVSSSVAKIIFEVADITCGFSGLHQFVSVQDHICSV